MLPTLRRVAVSALGFAAVGALIANPAFAKDSDGDDDDRGSDNDDKGGNVSIPASSGSESGQSTFVSPDKAIAFGFTVPEIRNDDIYFSIRVPIGLSWGAVGLGSYDMDGLLVLMIYMNEAGDNVTFSPRSSSGDFEPEHYPGFKYEVLPGTGLFDDHMVFSAHCTDGCQSWPHGYMDVSDSNQKATWAYGPAEGFQSDDPAAGVRYHASYGSFKIDMGRTFGNADPPVLDNKSTNTGTELEDDDIASNKWDAKSLFHGIVMIFAFIGMMPFGIVLLRVGHWVRWHAVNQVAAMVVAFGGFGLGIITSLLYQRSRGFNTAHQILGFIVMAFMLAQFVLGFLHHRAYKKTQKTTKMAPVHVWLGRIIIVLAVATAFLGFPLALKPHRNYILAGVVVVVFAALSFALVGRGLMDKVLGKRRGRKAANEGAEPWRHTEEQGGGGYGGNRAYSPPPPQNIGLMDVSSRTRARDEVRDDMGTAQRPKEFA